MTRCRCASGPGCTPAPRRTLTRESVDAEAIAAHLLLCDPVADPQNVASLEAAAALAMRRGSPSGAISYLERALAEPPPAAERAALVAQLGRAEMLTRRPGAVDHLQRALEQSGDPVLSAGLRLDLSEALFFRGQWDEALDLLQNARAGLERQETLSSRCALETKLITLGALEGASPGLTDAAIERLLELAGEERESAPAFV